MTWAPNRPVGLHASGVKRFRRLEHRGKVKRRHKRRPQERQEHKRITEIPIRLLGDRGLPRTAPRIARWHGGNTVRLAEDLAIATLQADALATTDANLANAAGAERLGVALMEALSS